MPSLYWSIPLATTLLGIALFIYGRRGRRTGSDPHCRKCDYNLTGLTSEKCPECGVIIAQTGICRGGRARSRLWIRIGQATFLCSLIALGIDGVRWYRALTYPDMPTWWLLYEAQHTDHTGRIYENEFETPGAQAYDELARRAGSLSKAQRRKLATIALNECLFWSRLDQEGGAIEEFAAAVLRHCVFDSLTPEEQQRFHENCFWVTWRARPQASVSTGIPLELGIAGRESMVMSAFGIRAQQIEITIIPPGGPPHTLREGDPADPRSVEPRPGDLTMPAPLGQGTDSAFHGGWSGPVSYASRMWGKRWTWNVSPVTAGQWTFTCRVTLDMPDNHQIIRTLTCTSDVAAQDSPKALRLVDDPKIGSELLKRIDVDVRPESQNHKRTDVCLVIKDWSPPVDVVCDLAFEVEGERFPCQPIILRKNCSPTQLYFPSMEARDEERPDNGYATLTWPRYAIRTITVILTPNPDLARQTVDITEIWGQPIRKEIVIPEDPSAPVD